MIAAKMNSLRYEAESAQKSMNACDERVAKLQKEWMKLQDQLIRASETIERENAAINTIMRAQTELEQMKIRLQGTFSHEGVWGCRKNEGEECGDGEKATDRNLHNCGDLPMLPSGYVRTGGEYNAIICFSGDRSKRGRGATNQTKDRSASCAYCEIERPYNEEAGHQGEFGKRSFDHAWTFLDDAKSRIPCYFWSIDTQKAVAFQDAELECVQMDEKLSKKVKEKQELENAVQEAE